eukprot:2651465-Pleurochrysis_carterae.AAC.1
MAALVRAAVGKAALVRAASRSVRALVVQVQMSKYACMFLEYRTTPSQVSMYCVAHTCTVSGASGLAACVRLARAGRWCATSSTRAAATRRASPMARRGDGLATRTFCVAFRLKRRAFCHSG